MELPFVPMLLDRVQHPFADPSWVWQVKWDGVRNLTLVEGGQVRHWSRSRRERTTQFPEFAGLGLIFSGRRAVLDGEIVVLREGRPSFGGILERDLAGSVPRADKLNSHPATLMVFDLLELGERELYDVPLSERLALLEQCVPADDAWRPVAHFPGSAGPDLYSAALAQGLEGVVAKRSDSRYEPDTRSRLWQKLKRRQEMLAVVCGYSAPAGRPGGLLLGAYRDGRLRYIGRVGSGISAEQLRLIREHLPTGSRPFDYEPSLRDRFSGPPGPVVWTDPRLTVAVAFTEWTADAKLRDPVLTGFSTQPPEAAQIP